MIRFLRLMSSVVMVATGVLLGREVLGNLILTPRYYTTNGVNAGTNLFINTDYIMRLELDSTGEPNAMIRTADRDVTVPTNAVLFTSGGLPATNDFFCGAYNEQFV